MYLKRVLNNYGIHHFMYDHKGERVMKSTLYEVAGSVNGEGEGSGSTTYELDVYTLYVNPYYIVNSYNNNEEGTKHYYMGAQRVASAQMSYTIVLAEHPPTSTDPNNTNAPTPIQDLGNLITELNTRLTSPITLDYNTLFDPKELSVEKPFVDYDAALDEQECWTVECRCAQSIYWTELEPGFTCEVTRVMYWYHPDYLGNVEFITKMDGTAHQFFWYSPWGEPLEEHHLGSGSFSSRFQFNAKEQDEETGNYYYGARYYNPKTSIWLSVDPLAKKFPNQTPYAFTDNNPVSLVDPTGMAAIDPDGVDGEPVKPPTTGDSGPETVPQSSNPNIPLPIDEGARSSAAGTERAGAETVRIAPAHTDSYEGFTGFLLYVWTGGNENGGQYDMDGNYLGPSPITGLPPAIIGGPLRKGQSAIKIGKYLFNPGYLHKVIKPQILKNAGNFAKVVGKNPDIGIKGNQIILNGAKNGPYAGKSFETGLKITDFIF